MKKILLYSAAALLSLSACRKEDTQETYKEPEDIAVQNSYDDQSIQKYLDTHYLDDLGNIKAFSTSDTLDDNYPKLSQLNPQKLSSGVVYIVREGAQPNPGTSIGSSDIIHLMSRSYTYLATSKDNVVDFTNPMLFNSTIDGNTIPEVDPSYYHVKQSVIDANPTIGRSFYEIEGFIEGLQKFKAFNKEASENYNLQGVIIVPSRAAFARDPHFNYVGYSMRNRSFVFNFQVYKSIPRS